MDCIAGALFRAKTAVPGDQRQTEIRLNAGTVRAKPARNDFAALNWPSAHCHGIGSFPAISHPMYSRPSTIKTIESSILFPGGHEESTDIINGHLQRRSNVEETFIPTASGF